jgi:hypothetical protein
MENNYYIYLHINLITGEPFYIGKGKGSRYKSKNSRSQHWKNIVNKYDYDILFLEINLNEKLSFEKEIYWIKRIGRKDLGLGPLVNFTDGGEGLSGYVCSEETKQKLREINLGRIQPRDVVDKIALANTGKKRTQELKDKMSAMFKGKTHSDEYKENCRQRQLGIPSHRKGKSRFTSEEEKKEAARESTRKYKLKLKLLKNENTRK